MIKLHIFATTNKIVRCKQTKREQGSPCAINVSHWRLTEHGKLERKYRERLPKLGQNIISLCT